MPNIVRLLRSLTGGARPSGHQYGEAYANFTDRAFGVVDNNGNPVDFASPFIGRGYVNRFISGDFGVWQRPGSSGLSISTSGGYAADRWLVSPVGAAVTAIQINNGSFTNNKSLMGLQINGAAGNTSVIVTQRIESMNCAALNNLALTVQIKMAQNSGAIVTPTVSLSSPPSRDTFTGGPFLPGAQSIPLQPLPSSGAWTQLAYTFGAFGDQAFHNGLQVDFTYPVGLVAGQTWYLAEADIRATPGLPAGLNASPPPAELRFPSVSAIECQRYYQLNSMLYGFAVNATTMGVPWHPFAWWMRAVPTVTLLTSTPSGQSPQFTVGRTGSGSTIVTNNVVWNIGGDLSIGGFSGMTANTPASFNPNQLSFAAEL